MRKFKLSLVLFKHFYYYVALFLVSFRIKLIKLISYKKFSTSQNSAQTLAALTIENSPLHEPAGRTRTGYLQHSRRSSQHSTKQLLKIFNPSTNLYRKFRNKLHLPGLRFNKYSASSAVIWETVVKTCANVAPARSRQYRW